MRPRQNNYRPKINYSDLIKPLSEKAETQVTWVGGFISNVQKDESTPVPPVSPSPTPTQTSSPTPTASSTPTPTPTQTSSPTPTPTPSATPPPESSITYITSVANAADSSSFPYNNINIEQEGLIVICSSGRDGGLANAELAAISINGLPANVVVAGSNHNNTNGTLYSISYLRVTGTTIINVAISFTQTMQGNSISVYRIDDNISDIPQSSRINNNANGSSTLNLSLTGLTGNNLIIGGAVVATPSGGDIVLTNLTENIELVTRAFKFANGNLKNNVVGTFTNNIGLGTGLQATGGLVAWV